MGCGSSSAVTNTAAPSTAPSEQPAKEYAVVTPAPTPPPPEPVQSVKFSEVHSAIRWNKPLEEVISLLKVDGASTIPDPKTGNLPIHIAAQNGHVDITRYLCYMCKVDVNAPNNLGNTALHMAIEYDYLEAANILLSHGASRKIQNAGGKLSGKGIEGGKSIELLALSAADNEEELLGALKTCSDCAADLTKSDVAVVGLKKKKATGVAWTDEVQVSFKALLERVN